ncbi:unnamed protein product, partial [Enterobius vermicularis]|uniref:Secreted protein n=1 Tax=Enterobius vermicularis TaxID=51028 RepID=A0A0N4VMU7_ENTVE
MNACRWCSWSWRWRRLWPTGAAGDRRSDDGGGDGDGGSSGVAAVAFA